MSFFVKYLRRKPFLSTFAIIILLLLMLLAWRKLFHTTPPQYLTVKLARGDIEEAVQASGTIRPSQQVSVGAQVSGQLKSLKVKLGERVQQGQLLAEIDPVIQQNELRRTEAALDDARAQRNAKFALLRRYELEQQRQAITLEKDASSRADYEAASADVASTRADMTALAARIVVANVAVDTARANLAYTQITAPMDGEVIAIVTQEGQTVVSAQTAPVILILANLDKMTVRAKISEADVIRVKPGLPVHFTILGAPDKRYHSTLRAIEPAPESIKTEDTQPTTPTPQTNNAVYYNGLFDVSNPAHTLLTSMTAQVSIVLGGAQHALLLPIAALGKRLQDDKHYEVRVLVNGQVHTRTITVGLSNDIDVQVLSGLSENDQVIAEDSTTATESGSGGSISVGG